MPTKEPEQVPPNSDDLGPDPARSDDVGPPQFFDSPVPVDGAPQLVPDMWFTAAIEEYRSLRIEIVDAIGAQRRIMQLGVGGMSVLVGFGLQPINRVASVTILAAVVPAVALFVTVGALGELVRAVRASAFLVRREAEIDRMVGVSRPQAMAWERWLRRGEGVSRRDRAEFYVLMIVAAGAALIAGFIGRVSPGPAPWWTVIAGGVVSAVLVLAAFIVFERRIRAAQVLFATADGRSWDESTS